MSEKLIDCGGPADAGRTGESLPFGLWHSTHIATWLRLSPWMVKLVWHPLQVAVATTVRRASIGDPSTEKLITRFTPASRTFFVSFVVPGSNVILRSPSIPIEYVPVALA